MVTCDSDSAHLIGGAFQLEAREAEEARQRPPSVSSLSMYKQKIDALFDDTRSIASLPHCGIPITLQDYPRRDSKASLPREDLNTTIYEDSDTYSKKKFSKINNSVQDRIERMFAEMAGESKLMTENIGVHLFNVHYLGSIPLQSKVTSLSGLQLPLKDLYFSYRRNFRHKNNLTGRLEISKNGLKVKYKGEKGDLEQLNPFPTIAVWSAVKFVLQPSEKENNHLSCAFLPLITDPDNIDRQALFKPLENQDKKYILSNSENSHSPLFAVVMRKIGVAKQLECHGFVCQTSEDAIVIAATLYKSLMSHMNRQNYHDKKKLKSKNGISCMSVTSSTSHTDVPTRPPRKKRSTSSQSGDSDRDGFSTNESTNEKPKLIRTKKISSESLPPPPPPPPMLLLEPKKITVEEVKAKLDSISKNENNNKNINEEESQETKSLEDNYENREENIETPIKSSNNQYETARSKVSEKIELFRELERGKNLPRPPSLPPPIPSKSNSDTLTDSSASIKEPLRRNHSRRKSLNETGDILTKVAIPRSGSFLNAGGLTRYKSLGQRNNGKKSGGSPLGFNELFHEFKVQENLHSMDDILNAIIDAEGMSFNDLKPIYKEFLLKLAVTLTKDEIFQHSKAIMKKQKKKILRRNSTFQNKGRKILKSANGLKMVFRLPFARELRRREKKKNLSSSDFHTITTNNAKVSESSVSTSSYDLRQFKPREPSLPPPKRQTTRQRSSKRSEKGPHVTKRNISRLGERTSTSEDSDFLTLSNRLSCQNRNSSSGYVSCSECDSDNCLDRCYCALKGECKSKCYCSAGEFKRTSSKMRLLSKAKNCKECERERYGADFSYCSCDSESCAESSKCYCVAPRRGVQSSQSLEFMRTNKPFPDRLRSTFHDYYENRGRTRSTSSRRKPEERSRRARSTDNLALDYELLFQNKPKNPRSKNMQRLTVRSNGTGSQDALSVKKSAEMAALFANIRLSQRTDVRALVGGTRRALLPPLPPTPLTSVPTFTNMFHHRPLSRNASLEDTLGYLP